MIATAASITTDAIKLAIDSNIDIVFLDEHGNPYGRVWQSRLGSTTLIRRRQLEMAQNQGGLDLSLEWIKDKLDNQIGFLERLRTTRPHKSSGITTSINEIREVERQLGGLIGTIEEHRDTIMGIEGRGARSYFSALNQIMPTRFQFDGRSRNPAKDEFNALLNYCYGILYSKVEKACIIAGLDPYVGFLHTDNYNKRSLVFDLIEKYRIWAEETVVSLFAARKIKTGFFDSIPGGLLLNKDGKAVLITKLNEVFDNSVRHKGRNIKRGNIIQFDCHNLSNKIIGEE